MSTPAYQATGTESSGVAARTVAWPVHAIGDIGLLFVSTYTAQAATLSTAAGFAAITDGYSDIAAVRLTVFWCRADSAAMTSPVVADSGDHQICQIVTYRGCKKSGNPWSVAPIWETQAANTAISFSSMTTDKPNTLMVYGLGINNVTGASMSGWTNANLASVNERIDTAFTGGSYNGGLAVADGLLVAPGASGATTATCSASRTTAHLILGLVGSVPSGSGSTFLNGYGVL